MRNILLEEWAQRHGVSGAAISELASMMAAPTVPPAPQRDQSEGAAQAEIRLEAPAIGVSLWRNNVGALIDERGIPVRYGLANDSSKLNKHIKSSDLIGFTPMKIHGHHVGRTVPIFTSIEVKPGKWSWHGSAREQAQHRWLCIVSLAGGAAGFARSKSDFRTIIEDATR